MYRTRDEKGFMLILPINLSLQRSHFDGRFVLLTKSLHARLKTTIYGDVLIGFCHVADVIMAFFRLMLWFVIRQDN